MNEYNLEFHHLGLATSDPAKACLFLTGIGYKIGKSIFDPLQGVDLIMCQHKISPEVEVISSNLLVSPILKLKSKHPNGLIYHSCFTTSNLDKSIYNIRKSNLSIICISEPKPAILFDGLSVSFYQLVGFGLIEIIETL